MNLKNFLLGFCLILGACAKNIKTDFHCSAPEGLGCVSMTKADEHVTSDHTHDNDGANDYRPTLNAIIKGEANSNEKLARAWTGPKRSLEKVFRIWFPSFVDKNGNYHDDSAVYISIPTETWIEEPKGE